MTLTYGKVLKSGARMCTVSLEVELIIPANVLEVIKDTCKKSEEVSRLMQSVGWKAIAEGIDSGLFDRHSLHVYWYRKEDVTEEDAVWPNYAVLQTPDGPLAPVEFSIADDASGDSQEDHPVNAGEVSGHIIVPGHKLWNKFLENLAGPQGINIRKEGEYIKWDCEHEPICPASKYILGLLGADIGHTMEILKNLGGVCDCKIVAIGRDEDGEEEPESD